MRGVKGQIGQDEGRTSISFCSEQDGKFVEASEQRSDTI